MFNYIMLLVAVAMPVICVILQEPINNYWRKIPKDKQMTTLKIWGAKAVLKVLIPAHILFMCWFIYYAYNSFEIASKEFVLYMCITFMLSTLSFGVYMWVFFRNRK